MEERNDISVIEEQKDTIVDDRNWCVYMHTNKINGKVYIGITSRQPEKRWGSNGSEYGADQPAFCAAIKKYGWDNFEHDVLFRNISKQDACKKEVELIAKYKSNCTKYHNPSYGYNMSDGGESGAFGHVPSEETRRKQSEALKGHVVSDETKQKLSKALKGRTISDDSKRKMSDAKVGKYCGDKHPMYGKHQSEESKKKMSDSKKDKYTGENNHRYGKHLSDDTKEKLRQARIGRTLSEETKKKIGIASTGRVVSEETRKKLSEINKCRPHRKLTDAEKKKISEVMTGRTVSQDTRDKISAALTGIKLSEERVQNMIDNSAVVKPVYCIEFNRYFKGVSAAKRETGVDAAHILECCKGTTNRKSAGKHPITGEKLHWTYVSIEEYNYNLKNLNAKENDKI